MNSEYDDVSEQEQLFTDAGVQALQEFGRLLQRIHSRLVSEGVEIEIDEHYKPKDQS